jgi:hypothetical protein
MQLKTVRFILGLLLLTGIIGLIAFLLFKKINPNYYPSIFPYILGFFFLVNAAFFLIFLKINSGENSTFIRNFILLFGVKFFLYLIAALAVLLFFKQEVMNIAVTAMILYLLYAGYEVFWLTSLVKRKKQNK